MADLHKSQNKVETNTCHSSPTYIPLQGPGISAECTSFAFCLIAASAENLQSKGSKNDQLKNKVKVKKFN